MPTIDVTVSCPVFDSFRVQQVAGMFDLPLAERASERFQVAMPELPDDWRIGLIVGPSGSGKTTIARRMFAGHVTEPRPWPKDRAVVDGLGDRPIKEVTSLFTAVGFGSPPSWVKPYHVLSTGEQFRCDLARALGEKKVDSEQWSVDSEEDRPLSTNHCPLVVFDEFTSVVDRNVAHVASAAIARGIQRGTIRCRFVAVTCHYDVTEWLQPDWVIDMATSSFSRRCLPRPGIDLEIFRCRRRAWSMFARHHYLSGSISTAARCYLALWQGVPVAFCATVTLIGQRNRWRISRIVVLPDYQGVGIGMRVLEAVAQLHKDEGHRVNATGSHPAVIAHWRRSPLWRTIAVKKTGSASARRFIPNYRGSGGRAVVSVEYVGAEGGRVESGE
jgi:GNAT superfamily N-acetyltransferase